MEKRINFGALTRYSVNADNSKDAARAYDISAEVKVTGDRITGIDNGMVRAIGEQTEEPTAASAAIADCMATFYANGGSLNIQYRTESGRSAITEAVEAFIADAEAGIKTAEAKL